VIADSAKSENNDLESKEDEKTNCKGMTFLYFLKQVIQKQCCCNE